ncbi:hypothetical protein [Terrabacter carboxydivorans]|uniref:hypothetical protein n=1 Tax=Terrabacter carboxydivorans TaxID=619730 RepID=UPI0031DA9DA9
MPALDGVDELLVPAFEERRVRLGGDPEGPLDREGQPGPDRQVEPAHLHGHPRNSLGACGPLVGEGLSRLAQASDTGDGVSLRREP